MPTEFVYKAYDNSGTAVLGSARMETAEAVKDLLAERNLIPISIKPRSKSIWHKIIEGFRNRSSREDLILFTRKLNALYKAGVPMAESVERAGRAVARFSSPASAARRPPTAPIY